MTTVEAPAPGRAAEREHASSRWAARLRSEPSARTAGRVLTGVFVLSSIFRALVAVQVHAPTAFSDELGYTKLALTIARTGHLGLFDKPGLSYSPLYPVLLSPIYALGASAPAAYALVKALNGFLISLSIFPTYAIARCVLPRRLSLIVAGLGAAAPLMMYPSFTMSENLAYPLCLVAVWALLRAIGRPSVGADVLLLASIVVATAARIQLVVLFGVALTAIVFAAAAGRPDAEPLRPAVVRSLRDHVLLFGLVGGAVAVAGLAGLAGIGVFDIWGRYAVVGRRNLPNVWHLLDILLRHVAGVDLAVGVVPFVAALVLSIAFVRARRPRPQAAFASVAVATTVWFVLETAFDAAVFDTGADVPRIHERFFIYVVPLFLVALLAAWRVSAERAPRRVYLAAAGVAALLPLAIPFGTVVNNTIAVDSFGLHPFARIDRGVLTALPYAAVAAVWLAGTLALLYVQVRDRLRSVLILAVIPFLIIWILGQMRIDDTSTFARAALPAHPDWVDRATSSDHVLLLGTDWKTTAALETAYENRSIGRVAYLCSGLFGPDFGEQPVTVDAAGRLRDAAGGFLRAPYVVVPWALGVRGRVVSWNDDGGEVLVQPPPGPLTVWPRRPTADYCSRA